MVDAGTAYAEVQARMSDVVAGLSEGQLGLRVPACPDWTVRDLVAHHTGVAADLAAGALSELGELSRLLNQNIDIQIAQDRDTMTARQVADRRDRAAVELLAEWAEATYRLLPMLRGEVPFQESIGAMGAVIAVNDVVVHEGDLREALGLEAAPVVHATSLALAGYGFAFDYHLRRLGLPALAFEYDGKQRVFGDGDPAVVLIADRTTLVRILASRLTRDDMLQLEWRGDPEPYLDVIGQYGPANPVTR